MANKLKGTRCYLCGPMDHTTDNGEGWRKQIRSDLSDLNITWLDPTRKPTIRAIENEESRKYLSENKAAGNFDLVTAQMKTIRSIDLRLTDMADFLVVHLDTRIYSFGTIEEMANANRQKKPIIIHSEQGKSGCANWAFGMVPHHTIFSTWEEVYTYLRGIDKSDMIDDPRWQFFNLEN